MTSGLCLLLGGFVYDIVFVGIPYPDPTPEMSASYALDSHIASLIRWVGLGSIFLGCVVGVTKYIDRQRPPGDV